MTITDTNKWEAGSYVLTVDKFSPEPGEDYVRGDVLELDEFEARRLGEGEAIAPVGSMDARMAEAQASGDPNAMKRIQAERMMERAKAMLAEVEADEEGEGGGIDES